MQQQPSTNINDYSAVEPVYVPSPFLNQRKRNILIVQIIIIAILLAGVILLSVFLGIQVSKPTYSSCIIDYSNSTISNNQLIGYAGNKIQIKINYHCIDGKPYFGAYQISPFFIENKDGSQFKNFTYNETHYGMDIVFKATKAGVYDLKLSIRGVSLLKTINLIVTPNKIAKITANFPPTLFTDKYIQGTFDLYDAYGNEAIDDNYFYNISKKNQDLFYISVRSNDSSLILYDRPQTVENINGTKKVAVKLKFHNKMKPEFSQFKLRFLTYTTSLENSYLPHSGLYEFYTSQWTVYQNVNVVKVFH